MMSKMPGGADQIQSKVNLIAILDLKIEIRNKKIKKTGPFTPARESTRTRPIFSPIVIRPDHAVLVVRLDLVRLHELMKTGLGILQRPVPVQVGREVGFFRLC